MAVPEQRIKARLKALYPKANLSQKRIDAYAAKLALKLADDADEATIDQIINDYNEVIDFEAVAKEDDRIRTLEKKAEEAAKNKGKGAGENDDDDDEVIKVDEDAPAWAKALLKQNETLSKKIETLESGKTLESKKATATQLFEKSEVLKGLKPELKERWIGRIDVNSQTPFEEQIQALEAEFSELVQVNADTNQYAAPAGGGNPKDVTVDQAVVDKIVEGI